MLYSKLSNFTINESQSSDEDVNSSDELEIKRDIQTKILMKALRSQSLDKRLLKLLKPQACEQPTKNVANIESKSKFTTNSRFLDEISSI